MLVWKYIKKGLGNFMHNVGFRPDLFLLARDWAAIVNSCIISTSGGALWEMSLV